MWIADVSIRRPVFALMITLALTALGLISLSRVGVDLFPKVETPYVSVTTALEGASADTIEREVTDVLEEYLNTIGGIETLRSTSSEGLSQVFVEFALTESLDEKAQDVRDKVSRALADLPRDVDPPLIEKMDPDAAPILSVMISGALPVRDLTLYSDNVIKERIQRLPGVGSVSLIGGQDREVRIWLDADRLRGYGIAVNDVIRAIQREHAEVPGGRLEADGNRVEFDVRTMGEMTSVAEFEDIVVVHRDGRATRLRDVARVEDGLADERTYAELDGKPGISLQVRRQSGRNTVEIAQAVKEIVLQLEKEAPPGVSFTVTQDVSRFIEASASDVLFDIVIGVILVVLVTLALMINPKATFIIALAVPTSLISTFFAFYLFDFTINMLTLLALSLAVGLLVDDAIVVIDSIDRHLHEGHDPMEAASLGVRRVGLAVLAGTLTVMAVFLPIAFMQGVIGIFFLQYGLAVVFSVAVSYLISVSLAPALAARMLTAELARGRLAIAFETAYQRVERAYGQSLKATMRRPWWVLVVALVAVVLGGVFASSIPMSFTSKTDRSEFLVSIELPLGTAINESKNVAQRASRALSQIRHVEHVFFSVAGDARMRPNIISYYVELTPKQERDTDQFTIMEEARGILQRGLPEAKDITVSEVQWLQGAGFAATEMEYALQGPDLAVLEEKSQELMNHMRANGMLADVKSSFERGKPEIQVHLDRKRSADLKVQMRDLADTVRALVGGLKVATYQEGGNRFDVRVRLEEHQRDELSKLQLIQVRSVDGRVVNLLNVADIRIDSGPSQIDRQSRTRKISVFANTGQAVALGDAANEVERIIDSISLGPEYQITVEGTAKRMQSAATSIVFALIFALVALYMILASQFNSLTQPMIIMLTAPLSFVGAFFALYVTGHSMSIFAQIGLVALMGLVMKNGILLVDYANQLKEGGMDDQEAILTASPVRLRPVLMTALSAIFGMLPVALATSDAAEWRNPMGVLVIGGMASSTLLTLFVVPTAYASLGRFRARVIELMKSQSFLRLRRKGSAEERG